MGLNIRYMIVPVLFFLYLPAFSQAPYQKIYSQTDLDMPAEMPLNNAEFTKFISTNIFPVLEAEVKANPGKIISKLRMQFTISEKGEIMLIEFPGLEAGSETHRKLAETFMKMGTWKPGIKEKRNVCSEFSYSIDCIKWQ
jgi:hypothetical protein